MWALVANTPYWIMPVQGTDCGPGQRYSPASCSCECELELACWRLFTAWSSAHCACLLHFSSRTATNLLLATLVTLSLTLACCLCRAKKHTRQAPCHP